MHGFPIQTYGITSKLILRVNQNDLISNLVFQPILHACIKVISPCATKCCILHLMVFLFDLFCMLVKTWPEWGLLFVMLQDGSDWLTWIYPWSQILWARWHQSSAALLKFKIYHKQDCSWQILQKNSLYSEGDLAFPVSEHSLVEKDERLGKSLHVRWHSSMNSNLESSLWG